MKKKTTLKYFQDPKEDKRISIDIYFNKIYEEIKKITSSDKINISYSKYKFNNILPDMFNLNLRISRYVLFPIYFLFTQKRLNHILDQSYAHLLFLKFFSKNIVTVHDLMPLLSWNKKIDKSIYSNNPLLFKLSLLGLKKADKIIAVSQTTKDDIVQECNINPEKISVIHNGVSEKFRVFTHPERIHAKKFLNLMNENFKILIVGNSIYKNVHTSYEVIKRLDSICSTNVQLIWLGGSKDLHDAFTSKKDTLTKVHIFNDLNEEECVMLYNSVDCLLFPSLYEGFGLPPLEAMKCGIPVVASNIKVFKELYIDSAMMAGPKDIDKLAKLIKELIENENHKSELITRGINRSKSFSWKKTASKLNDIYNGI